MSIVHLLPPQTAYLFIKFIKVFKLSKEETRKILSHCFNTLAKCDDIWSSNIHSTFIHFLHFISQNKCFIALSLSVCVSSCYLERGFAEYV